MDGRDRQQLTGAQLAPMGPECASTRSYTTAVILSALFGYVGVQHFYLGRHWEGILDLGLTLGWIFSFAAGEPILGGLFLVADVAHALLVSILLLTGNFRDGEGCRVCYPGQPLCDQEGRGSL